MDGVPVKISERCRPPSRVHLPATLRAMPSEATDLTCSFDHEGNALQWMQERRRNLTEERTERRRRLEIKDAERQRRRQAEAEAAKQREAEAAAQRETEAAKRKQQEEEEAARRQREEEDRLRNEEQERLEEFRLRRQASQAAVAAAEAAKQCPSDAKLVTNTESVTMVAPSSDQPPSPDALRNSCEAVPQSDASPPAAPSVSGAGTSQHQVHAASSSQTNAPSTPQLPSPPAASRGEQASAACQQAPCADQQERQVTSEHTCTPAVSSTAQQPRPAAAPVAQHAAATAAPQVSPAAGVQQSQQQQVPALGQSVPAHTVVTGTEATSAAAARQQQQQRSQTVVSNNPYNPFVSNAAVLQPHWTGVQQTGEVARLNTGRSGSFNYRDFESQATDPFDSVALKSINDMEVLASVFQPTVIYPQQTQLSQNHAQQQQQQPPVSQQQQQKQAQQQQRQPPVSQQQQKQAQQQQRQSPVSQQQQQVPSQQQQQQYFSHAGASAQSSVPTGYSYQRPPYSSFPAGPGSASQPQPSYNAAAVPQYRYTGYAYAAGGGNARPTSFHTASSSTAPYSPSPAGGAAAPSDYLAVSSASVVAVADPGSVPADPRQLQEFYTRYYAPPGRASPAPGLRSSRSVPDLSDQAEADQGAVKRTKSHTPPPQAAANGVQVWPTGAAPEGAAPPPDPLQGASPEVRVRLQELSQMGFPLDRLHRLHTQFNGDEKQVIDFALSAQRLEEAGHAPLAAEQGLLECDGDLGRAAEFLSSLAQLTGLGFPAPRAMDALRKADMHRDRALDLLILG